MSVAIDTSKINLRKSVETLDRFLLTKGLRQAPTMRVIAPLDVSGSMGSIIRRGDLQRALNQLVPVGLKFDDNGEIDVLKFDNVCEVVGTANQHNYEDFVARNGIAARGGTEYAPIVRKVLQEFFRGVQPAGQAKGLLGMFSKAPTGVAGPATLVQIVTDGDCSDAAKAEQAFKDSAGYNVYWQFIAVGGASFRTIKRLADDLPNVGDVYLRDFGMTDEQVYQQVISDELVGWINQR